MTEPNGWTEYRKLVLKELEDLCNDIKDIRTDMATIAKDQVTIKEEISALKVKSGIWGAISGAVVVLITITIEIVLQRK